MHKLLKVSAVVAVLLAGAGASYRLVLPATEAAPQRWQDRPPQQRKAIENCLEAAQMVFAVHWAVACTTEEGQSPAGEADGNAECDLPHSKAAAVNAWLDRAEKACFAESLQSAR